MTPAYIRSLRRADVLRPIAVGLFLAAITWAVFGQTLGFDFVNHDDPDYVYANPEVTRGLSFGGVRWALTQSHAYNWHPLTWISHMLDVQLFGLRAGGHHFTSVALHSAAVLLLFRVLWQMTGALWRSGFVAALFAIHPLRAESVAWIAERKDVLSGVLFMLTLGAYLRYSRKPSPVRYFAVATLFALGLMAKPMLVTLPFVLLLLDCWPLRRMESSKRLLLEKAPLLLLSAASCVATVLAQRGAINSLQRLSPAARMGNSLVSYVTYLWKMICPVGLALRSSHVQREAPLSFWLLCAFLLISISAAVFAFRRTRPYAVTAWLWYLGMLVPVIGIVQVGEQAHADRYTYLPQIGLYILLTWGIADLTTDCPSRRVILGASATLALSLLAWRTTVQVSYWRDSESLWRHTLAVLSKTIDESNSHLLDPAHKPEASLIGDAHYDLGTALLVKGRVDEAIDEYTKVLAGRTDYLAETENNLGNALLQKGRTQEAIPYFQKALELQLDHAEEAHYNLGNAFLQIGDTDQAIVQFQKVLEARPTRAEAHYHLGNALLDKGATAEAAVHYQQAITLRPNYAEAYNNLGNASLRQGRIDEAMAQFQKALAFATDHAEATYYNLGNALLQKGAVDEAIAQYRHAIELRPDYPEAHNNLGNALLGTGRIEEAIDNLRKAVEARENYAEAHYNLANALVQRGQAADAIEYYQKAVAVRPNYPDAQNNLAGALMKIGHAREAFAQYELALKTNPDSLPVLNNFAWSLATISDASLRDGTKALSLARRANELTRCDNPIVLHTLAVAYATNGQFREAIETAQTALKLSEEQKNSALTAALQTELQLYRAGLPYHEP